MTSHQETSATDSAQSNKRKPTSTAEPDTPNKRPNIDLEGGQLAGGQQPVLPGKSYKATLCDEVYELENQVNTKSNMHMRVELTKYVDS
jgi:hypothetical protein